MLSIGRSFSTSWRNGSSEPEVIISWNLAKTLSIQPAETLGMSLDIGGIRCSVVGVASRGLEKLWTATDAWTSPNVWFDLTLSSLKGRTSKASPVWDKEPSFFTFVALRPQQKPQSVAALLHKPEFTEQHLQVAPGLTNDPGRDAKVQSWTRLIFAVSALLIASTLVNYCGILFAQSLLSEEEIRMRRVLGAQVAHLLMDSVSGPILTVFGSCVIGILVFLAGARIFVSEHETLLPNITKVWTTTAGFLFAEVLVVVLLTAIIAILPVLSVARSSLLFSSLYRSTSGRAIRQILYGLVSIQLMLCILATLVTVALVRNIYRISTTRIGFDRHALTAYEIGPVEAGASFDFTTAGQGNFPLATATSSILDSLSVPGLRGEHIAAGTCAPLGQPLKTLNMSLGDGTLSRSIRYCTASRDILATLGSTLIAGRNFSQDPLTGAPSEVLINEQLAHNLWAGQNPLNRFVTLEEPAWDLRLSTQIVGVFQDITFSGPESSPEPMAIIPLRGNAFTLSFPMYFMLRGPRPTSEVEPGLNRTVGLLLPSLGIVKSYSVDALLEDAIKGQRIRFYVALGATLAITVVALMGLNGLLLYSVNVRNRDFALRICFGASSWEVSWAVIKEGLLCAAAGATLACLVWRPFSSLLPYEWLTISQIGWTLWMLVFLVWGLIALLVALRPARRAVRIPPAEILKQF
jgi:hypothetical protein